MGQPNQEATDVLAALRDGAHIVVMGLYSLAPTYVLVQNERGHAVSYRTIQTLMSNRAIERVNETIRLRER
jgi:hypothetical protein